jgi:ATP/maltotriose-dependent transcriptional regulator MalT
MCLAGLSHAGAYGGNPAALMQALAELQGFAGELPAIGPAAQAVATLVNSLHHIGQRDQARELQQRIEAAPDQAPDPVFVGWRHLGRAVLGLYEPDLRAALESARAARAAFVLGRDELASAMATMLLGSVEVELGLLEDCHRHSVDARERARQLGIGFVGDYATIFIGLSDILRGRHDKGIATLEPLLGSADLLLGTVARMERAYGYLLAGRLEDAHRESTEIVDATGFLPLLQATTLAILAAAELASGDATRALATVDRARSLAEVAGMVPMYESLLLVTEVDALLAGDRREPAAERLRQARDRLDRLAAGLDDSAARDAFFARIPAHARIRERAAALHTD